MLIHIREQMIRRCYDKGNKSYYFYGGRGIKVCQEWRRDWRSFRDWAMEHGFFMGLEIDRIDNDGDYTPDNCRFVTRKVNQRNRRDNRRMTCRGITLTLAEWSELLGIARSTIKTRIDREGWSVERALTTPVEEKFRNKKASANY